MEPQHNSATPPAGLDGYSEATGGIPLLDAADGRAGAVQAAPAEWFALVVKPRFDKAVGRMLEAKGFETLVPTYRKYHAYGARSKISEIPLFPGYVCCRFDVRRCLPILSTPGVVRVVGTPRVPMPLAEAEINALQAAIRAHIPVQPFPFVNAGQRVRITRGTLAGIEGIVLGPKPKLRIVLSITLLQRSVLLEIDRDQVCAEGAVNMAALYEDSPAGR
jgi:transcription antitermination factor NusG